LCPTILLLKGILEPGAEGFCFENALQKNGQAR